MLRCLIHVGVFLCRIKTLNMNIPVSTPRIISRQVHRANAPTESLEMYYERNITIPFLNHITTELETRSGPIHQTKVKLFGLILSIVATYPFASTKDVGELYKTDLPSRF